MILLYSQELSEIYIKRNCFANAKLDCGFNGIYSLIDYNLIIDLQLSFTNAILFFCFCGYFDGDMNKFLAICLRNLQENTKSITS